MADEPAKAPEAPKAAKVCTHCGGAGELMHGTMIPCPWCNPKGDKSLRGSE